MNTRKTLALAALIGTGSLAVAFAQTPPPNSRSTNPSGIAEAGEAAVPHQRRALGDKSKSGKMSLAADRRGADPATFVKKAALGGLTEVELARTAQGKTQDPAIRKFADRMAKDHSKANAELATLAQGKGLQVPASLDAEHQAVVQKLSAKSGPDFDAAYAKQMMQDHEKTVALFEGATKSSDADLAAFAKKTLPTLKEHERMADSLPGMSHTASAQPSTPRHE